MLSVHVTYSYIGNRWLTQRKLRLPFQRAESRYITLAHRSTLILDIALNNQHTTKSSIRTTTPAVILGNAENCQDCKECCQSHTDEAPCNTATSRMSSWYNSVQTAVDPWMQTALFPQTILKYILICCHLDCIQQDFDQKCWGQAESLLLLKAQKLNLTTIQLMLSLLPRAYASSVSFFAAL